VKEKKKKALKSAEITVSEMTRLIGYEENEWAEYLKHFVDLYKLKKPAL
jgi:hypothetical protein